MYFYGSAKDSPFRDNYLDSFFSTKFNFSRLHSRKVLLNNEGAKLVVLKDLSLTLAEIDKNDYNFDRLIGHIGAERPFEDGFLMSLVIQKLACGGMILIFSFNHLLCDVNSAYLFVTEFSSQVKSLEFKFDQKEVSDIFF